jgi:hypothetical protein
MVLAMALLMPVAGVDSTEARGLWSSAASFCCGVGLSLAFVRVSLPEIKEERSS